MFSLNFPFWPKGKNKYFLFYCQKYRNFNHSSNFHSNEMGPVRSLDSICSSTTSNIVLKPYLFKADQQNQTEANTGEMLLCWISRYKLTASLVSGGQADIYAWSHLLWGYSMIFSSFCGITGCGSASLKLCICNVASPWSQSPFPDSQCGMFKMSCSLPFPCLGRYF